MFNPLIMLMGYKSITNLTSAQIINLWASLISDNRFFFTAAGIKLQQTPTKVCSDNIDCNHYIIHIADSYYLTGFPLVMRDLFQHTYRYVLGLLIL